MRLNAFQQVVDLDDVPDDKIRLVIGQLLQFLKLEIVQEQTPDYTFYELRRSSDE